MKIYGRVENMNRSNTRKGPTLSYATSLMLVDPFGKMVVFWPTEPNKNGSSSSRKGKIELSNIQHWQGSWRVMSQDREKDDENKKNAHEKQQPIASLPSYSRSTRVVVKCSRTAAALDCMCISPPSSYAKTRGLRMVDVSVRARALG
jgi:hypothetical protein